jgi:predicted  nucleic acid-binding Zn-ribbon protein
MPTPLVEQILIIQDRDRHRRDLEKQLTLIPREIALVEGHIAREKASIDQARLEIKELETKKKTLETEIGSAEQRAAKYKSQQLEVKKNDEYRAIGQEIDNIQNQIGLLEEKELGLMYSIDEAKKKVAAAEALHKGNISGYENRIRTMRELETSVKAQHQESLVALAAVRKPVDEASLRLYDRIASHTFPVCVPVDGGKCGGCHLKISAESEEGSRGKTGELATCDQCGCIIWWNTN